MSTAAPTTVDPVALTRSLVDIDSTTGREGDAAAWLSRYLRDRGYVVTEQPIGNQRFNVYAQVDPTSPQIVFSTHIDCVPPFFPSRMERGLLFGRGSCDAKGILAAQVAAVDALRAAGETRVAMLFVAGEERGSDGARVANEQAPEGVRYLINGEPTDNRLGAATRGILRVRLHASGRAAHSSFPELGDSAIDKLLDVLARLKTVPLPSDPILGETTLNVGTLSGGRAHNVVADQARAEVTLRTVGDTAELRRNLAAAVHAVPGARIAEIRETPAVHLGSLLGFETTIVKYTTDIPRLSAWGQPFLLGPGSIHVAHTPEERVSKHDLKAAVHLYKEMVRRLQDR